MKRFLDSFRPCAVFSGSAESGVTATEYAIMLVLICIAVVVSVPGFRDGVINTFATTMTVLNTGLANVAP